MCAGALVIHPALPGSHNVPTSLNLRLDPETSGWLARVSFDTRCTKQGIVVQALRAFLAQWPMPAR